MAKSVELTNGQVFKSKKAAEQHFREMLARYNDGDQISGYQDHSDLSALLERFDLLVSDGPSKIGAGIKRFERRLNKGDGWSSPGFWVIRVDDTPTDFSYVQAVVGRPKSDAEEFSVACHNAVSRDLLAMKQRQFDHFAGPDGLIACDITGNLVGYPEAQLSHAYPPFGMIVKEFRNLKGWVEVLPPGTLTASADAQISTHFSDKAIAQEFLDFHHDRAVLRIIGKDRPPISLSSLPIVKRPLRFR
ncbi:DCL family protein [Agrobacterium tumefaciens]|uniref:DCL family protein n=1 Tax=Agrobacterium tumefaciens TaxID=358 RepID=UPI001CBD2996|nr:DCL family protein [Agrobacterium tumefaciens]